MNKTIEIARKAGESIDKNWLERFAALVRADERNRTWTQEHWTEYERSIAAQEREACAKVCEPQEEHDDPLTAWKIAAAIRARSNT